MDNTQEATAEEKVFGTFGRKPEFRYFDRSLNGYVNTLFSDNRISTSESEEPAMLGGLQAEFAENLPETIEHWVSPNTKNIYKLSKDSPLWGGRSGFFASNVRILDIGSGGGTAVKQINEQFSHKGVKAIGLDIRYSQHLPSHAKTDVFIAGEWGKMPFNENSFDRLLSYESFPKYMWSRNVSFEDIKNTFKEITRIAKPEALWRGTLPTEGKDEGIPLSVMGFLENGWEVFIFPGRTFAAKLVNKQ